MLKFLELIFWEKGRFFSKSRRMRIMPRCFLLEKLAKLSLTSQLELTSMACARRAFALSRVTMMGIEFPIKLSIRIEFPSN